MGLIVSLTLLLRNSLSEPKTQKVKYLINPRKSLSLEFGGNTYSIPSGETSIADLAKKLDVSEQKANQLADHAAAAYGTYRPPTGAKDRDLPPQRVVRLETRVEPIPEPQDRVSVFQRTEEFFAAYEDESRGYN